MRPSSVLAILLLAAGGLTVGAEEFPGLHEWTDATLGPNLKGLDPDQWVVLELYSSWCPACRKFQPYYQGAAAALAREARVLLARLDCVSNNDECKAYAIRAFPTLFLGRAADMADHKLDSLTRLKPVWDADKFVESVKEALPASLAEDLRVGDASAMAGTDAGAVLGRRGGTESQTQHLHTDAVGGDGAAAGGGVTSDGGEAGAGTGGGEAGEQLARARATALNDIEGSTLRSWSLIGEAPASLSGPEARQALSDWVTLLSSAHPLERCRAGAAVVAARLPELWPAEQESPGLSLVQLDICPGSTFKAYQGCAAQQGGNADRAFTCALWQLLHATAAGLGDGPRAGASWLVAARGFVRHYFMCSECADHFVAATQTEAAAGVQNRRDAVLWLWRTHNTVNRRLDGEARPEGPHPQWPGRGLCPKCHGESNAQDADGEWVEHEVLAFLNGVYGREEGSAAGAAAGAAHGKPAASWTTAVLVLLAVAVALAILLHRSKHYSLGKARTF